MVSAIKSCCPPAHLESLFFRVDKLRYVDC